MARTPVWKSIAINLTDDIAQGRYETGAKLPAESQLAERFGVNRHTVRRALADMADQGLVHARRGAGVFVASKPADYPMGKRIRFHQNLKRAGLVPSKKVLMLDSRGADGREADALDLEIGDPVVVYEGLSYANDHPVALAQTIFPSDRLPGLQEALSKYDGITDALAACGVEDYTRRETRITAKLATATQALHLRTSEGAPILRTTGISVDTRGRVIEYGRTWFAGDRVTLTLGDE